MAVDGKYDLTDVYIPETVEIESKRKICFFPFRSGGESESSIQYLSKGIPAILVTRIRKLGYVYDPKPIETVRRSGSKFTKPEPGPQEEKKNKKTGNGTQDDGKLHTKNSRRLEYERKDLEEILRGEKQVLPDEDPRYIPLEVEFFRDLDDTPESESAFRLGSKFGCNYIVTGEYRKTGEDSIESKYELTNVWDGSRKEHRLSTSLKRAFQELPPLSEKMVTDLIQKPLVSVQIDTGNISEVLVFADGNYLGKTPLKDRYLTAGKHRILLTKPGYKEMEKEITLLAERNPSFSYKMDPIPKESYLSVQSTPSGAEVYLGIQKIGETPLEKVKVESGKNRLRISKEGFIDEFTGVDLVEGQETNRNFTLRSGDTEIYYANRDNIFLDYTYKDFATYSLFGTLLFYAGHIYFQMQANRAIDSLRPEIQIVNFATYQQFANEDPNFALGLALFEETKIQRNKQIAERYRFWSGDLGIDRTGRSRFQPGVMIFGMVFMLASAGFFYSLGLNAEAFDIGFNPGWGTRDQVFSDGGILEAKGHIHYNFRF